MKTAKINAILPYFGGKRTLAPRIVQELGEHQSYFEPFCGSMAVLFAKQACRLETVNDLHGDLVNLARVLQCPEDAPWLYDQLQRVVLCETLLRDARHYLETKAPPAGGNVDRNRAYFYFLSSWMGRNGAAGCARQDYQLAVRWTNSGGSPAVRWRNAIESIPWWHRRLQNVVILRRDAFSFLHKLEDVPETAIYCDPPYLNTTRGNHDLAGCGRYLHEFSHQGDLLAPDDHTRLRDVLAAYKRARIVVSYYDSPEIRELYQGWTFVRCGRQKNLARQNGRGTTQGEAPEVLIINGPSLTEKSA